MLVPPEAGVVLTTKDLFDMMVKTTDKLDAVATELEKTQVMIRDYNGLREEVQKNRDEIRICRGEFQQAFLSMTSKSEGVKETKQGFTVNTNTIISALAFLVAVWAVIKGGG
jgi:hypothetical protein